MHSAAIICIISGNMNAVVTFVVLSALLVAGKILRMQIPLLQRMYLPSSVVGGMLGLVLIRWACPASS